MEGDITTANLEALHFTSSPAAPTSTTLLSTLPEILVQIFAYLTPHQQRRLAGQVCHQWRTIVFHRFLSVTDKAFPTNVMEEGGGWGGGEHTALLAAPRMVHWQLGTRVGSAVQELDEKAMQRDGQVAGGTGGVSKDLRKLLEESGSEILRFFRSREELEYVRNRSVRAPYLYLPVHAELVARYWRSALAPLEKRPSSSSFPSPSGETTPEYTVKELRFESETVTDWGVIPRVVIVLSLGSTVTILRIDYTRHWDLLHLLAVMDALSRLEELYVEPREFTTRPWYFPQSDFFTQEQEDQLTGSVDGLATGTLPPPLRTQGIVLMETRVRVLVVFGAAVTLPAIEAVVRRCPLVEVLKFSQTVNYCRHIRAVVKSTSYSDFWPYLRDFCKHLREFQYSTLHGTVTVPEIYAIHSALPRMDVTTGEPGDIVPPRPRTASLPHNHHHRRHHYPNILCLISRDLGPMQDYIKTFKANWLTGLRFDRVGKGTTQHFQNALHMILCACPNLIIFTALSVYFYLPDMDVNNLLESDGSYRKKNGALPTVVEPTRVRQFGGTVIESTAHEEEEQLNLPPPKRRAVWACRNLRTLHISIMKQDDKDCARHESSLVIFGYLSLICPRLEELSIRSEWMALDDESGLCLLGRLKYLERLQLHSLPTLVYPDVFWMRRKKFKSGFLRPVDGKQHAFLTEQTLLGRIIAESRNPQSGRVHVTDPTVYLKKLPPLPDFQEPKPFLAEDGIDLSSVGRPDALIAYVMDTNKDLMADSDTSIDAWSRDAVCLPRLDLLYFRQSGDFQQETADAEQFLRTLRPEIDLRIEIAKYYI